MTNIDVAFLKNGKARIYNRELCCIADYIEVDRERAENIVRDKNANILLLAGQITPWNVFISALERNAVIIDEYTVSRVDTMKYGYIKFQNGSYDRITLDGRIAGMIEDDRNYLMETDYTFISGTCGKVQLVRKLSSNIAFKGSIETASVVNKRALEMGIELQSDNVIIRYIDGVMTYGHKK